MAVINLLMVTLCSVFGPGSELISLRPTFCNPTLISVNNNNNSSSYTSRGSNILYEEPNINLNTILGPLKSSQSLSVLIEGTRRGMIECQEQFKNERWNCTPSEVSTRSPIFEETIKRGSREAAFIHAITSAGMVHALTEACSSGNLTDCSCDRSRIGDRNGQQDDNGQPYYTTSTDGLVPRTDTSTDWKWGGCSDNVRYGMMFVKYFLDQEDRRLKKQYILHQKQLRQQQLQSSNSTTTIINNNNQRSPQLSESSDEDNNLRPFMNLHNNRVGRMVVNDHMVLKCRCHGISGSCELKTCWRTLPSFNVIGNILKEKYDNSIQINPSNTIKSNSVVNNNRRRSSSSTNSRRHGNQHISSNVRSRDTSTSNVSTRKNKNNNKRNNINRELIPTINAGKRELIYLNRNLNYCLNDQTKGIIGTSGRICTKDVSTQDGTSLSPDSCYLLCCGRGYNTMIKKVTTRCDCKFQWCCNVTCNICENESEIYTCK